MSVRIVGRQLLCSNKQKRRPSFLQNKGCHSTWLRFRAILHGELAVSACAVCAMVGLSGCWPCVCLPCIASNVLSSNNCQSNCVHFRTSMANLPFRRGQAAQANPSGLSACWHVVFWPRALLVTSSPTKAAATTGCTSEPSSMANLQFRHSQSAPANLVGLSGCWPCVCLPCIARNVLSSKNCHREYVHIRASIANLQFRRGQAVQATNNVDVRVCVSETRVPSW